jgi:hypothetical protein
MGAFRHDGANRVVQRRPGKITSGSGARELLSLSGGVLLNPPYGSICDLNPSIVASMVNHEDLQYVAAVGDAMKTACESRPERTLSHPLRDSLLLQRMVERHSVLLDWLLQGGDPAAARTWVHSPTSGRNLMDAAQDPDMIAA